MHRKEACTAESLQVFKNKTKKWGGCWLENYWINGGGEKTQDNFEPMVQNPPFGDRKANQSKKHYVLKIILT